MVEKSGEEESNWVPLFLPQSPPTPPPPAKYTTVCIWLKLVNGVVVAVVVVGDAEREDWWEVLVM